MRWWLVARPAREFRVEVELDRGDAAVAQPQEHGAVLLHPDAAVPYHPDLAREDERPGRYFDDVVDYELELAERLAPVPPRPAQAVEAVERRRHAGRADHDADQVGSHDRRQALGELPDCASGGDRGPRRRHLAVLHRGMQGGHEAGRGEVLVHFLTDVSISTPRCAPAASACRDA